MGSVGDAYDNAMAASFFSTLEAELLSCRQFASQAEAKMACFSYIEGWYNPVRLHSALGYRSPIAYEANAPKAQQSMVSAVLRQAFIQPDRVSQILRHVANQLRDNWPGLAASSTRARPTCWRTWASPPSTGPRSTQPIRSSA